jgi:predicted transcriptional regulator
MGKNRDRLSIVADILEVTAGGASKTHIMFAANLSFKLLEKYLRIVINAGFVQSGNGKYLITLRGRSYLDAYRLLYKRYINTQSQLIALDSEREKMAMLFEDLSGK